MFDVKYLYSLFECLVLKFFIDVFLDMNLTPWILIKMMKESKHSCCFVLHILVSKGKVFRFPAIFIY